MQHRDVLYVAVGQLGGMALGAIFWILMATILLPGEYGKVNFLISIATFASFGTSLGLGRTIAAYYPKEGEEELISGSVILVIIASMIAAGISAVFGQILVGLLIIGLSFFTTAYWIELGRRVYKKYMWLWIGVKLVCVPLALLMYFQIGLSGVLLGYALPHVAIALWSFRDLHFSANPGLKEVRKKASFARQSLGTDLAMGSSIWSDKIVVGVLFSFSMLGIYQFAYQIYMLMSFLPVALASYLLPEKSAKINTRKVELWGVGISLLFALIAAVFAPLIIPWLFPKYAGSVPLIQIMGFAVIPATVAAVKMSGFFASDRPRPVLVSYLLAVLVGIAGIVLLGGYFGAIGLAMSAVLLQLTLAAFLLFTPSAKHSKR